jgi:hypothetical protein
MILTLMLLLAAIIPAGLAEEIPQDPFEEIIAEFKDGEVADPYQIVTKPARVTGWVNVRWAPSRKATILATYPAKTVLTVIAETPNWLQVEDEETDIVGFIHKSDTADPSDLKADRTITPTVTDSGKTNLGVIDINGAFSLQCKMADGYAIQHLKSTSDQMVALISSDDPQKPMLQLSVGFDEAYASVERLNDLDEEELAKLEKTFTDADPMVEISYGDTGLGTRLMIAHLNEDDTDFLDFMSIYKGYFVECVMVPSYEAEDKNLTEEQVAMCIEFLTEMDFVPAESTGAEDEISGRKYITNLVDYDPEANTVQAIVMHTVTLDEDTVNALKAGDTLEYGTVGDRIEIESLEKDEDGVITINNDITLVNYGGEYHIYFWELEYLEELTRLTLEIPDSLVVLDGIDQETGVVVDPPKELSVEEFKAMLASEEYPDFATDNVWVTFDDNGQMAAVERFFSPAQ